MLLKQLPIKTEKGDEIVVSLFCPYQDTIKDFISPENSEIPMVEICIERKTSFAPVDTKVFGFIISKLIDLSKEYNDKIIYYYSCDNTNDLPFRSPKHAAMPPEDYRNKLFSTLFERNSYLTSSYWMDEYREIPVNNFNFYFHLIYKKNIVTSKMINEILSAIKFNADEIISRKNDE